MSAQTLQLPLGAHGADDLPDGFVIEERLDVRQNPAPIVFDLFHAGKRVAWTLRSRNSAIRWAWRIAGVPGGPHSPEPLPRRASVVAPWWAEAS